MRINFIERGKKEKQKIEKWKMYCTLLYCKISERQTGGKKS